MISFVLLFRNIAQKANADTLFFAVIFIFAVYADSDRNLFTVFLLNFCVKYDIIQYLF